MVTRPMIGASGRGGLHLQRGFVVGQEERGAAKGEAAQQPPSNCKIKRAQPAAAPAFFLTRRGSLGTPVLYPIPRICFTPP